MKSQTPHRGNENKKQKPTKADKLYNFLQKEQRRATPAPVKKTQAAPQGSLQS